MTASERNEFDGIAVIRPCGCRVCADCGRKDADKATRERKVFEAMREALRDLADPQNDARRGIYRVTLSQMSKARAALALADAASRNETR